MTNALTISTQKPAETALDYEALRRKGIEWLERTASAKWTDFNVHDPGITTLELLCYALTDLAYRTAYSIPDLLATEENTADNIRKHFFSARHIFPNKAVTIQDYRKLVIDIEGVKNAWLQKDVKKIFADLIHKKLSLFQPQSRKWEPVLVKGYYHLLIEFDTNVTPIQKTGIVGLARDVLMNNRNLCEDFLTINEVEQQEFRLCSEIEIKPGADPFDTLAKIFFNLQLHLTPLVRFYSLEELINEHYTADKIFEGPLLSNGFIKEEELSQSDLKTELHLSDIMHEIMKEPGVLNILEIIFNPTDLVEPLPNKWIIGVARGKQPVLNILESNVLFYKEGNPFRPNMQEVKHRFEKLMADHLALNEAVETTDIPFDTGSFQDSGHYHSIQNHYPKNYGISHWGLPGDASNERKTQAKQLQGYLYFFDQQLANYLAQLSHLRNLFSLQPEQHTYFSQVVNDFRGAEQLFVNPVSIAGNLQDAAENATTFYERRNSFLDHLLARFSETFFDYNNPTQADSVSEKIRLISAKEAFLQDYPAYSTNRFNAYNYTQEVQLWDTSNTSGLEKRLGRLLGFGDIRRRNLVNIFSAIRQAPNASNVTEFWFELINTRTSQVLLVAANKFPSAETAERRLEDVFGYSRPANFSTRVDDTDGKFILEQKDPAGNLISVSSQRFDTATSAATNLLQLLTLLSESQAEEGMFLVEHHLLLPTLAVPASPLSPPLSPVDSVPGENISGVFMPICVDANCDDCDTSDPYSFRVSVVLPAYAKRFLDMDFRRYCERTIRSEMPAHIFPKICWVGNEQLYEFELAYKEWLEVKAGVRQDVNNLIATRFVNILTHLKNIYPPARLEDCSNAAERKLFLLNQNALGTLKT